MIIHRMVVASGFAFLLTFGACGLKDVLSPDDPKVEVANRSSVVVENVAVSSCGKAEFEVKITDLRQGQTKSFDIEEGCYDLRAQFESLYVNAFDFEVELKKDKIFSWTLGDQ